MVMVVEIELQRNKMITRVVNRIIQPREATHECYPMFFQCLHNVPNFFGPGIVRRTQKRHAGGISEPEGEKKRSIAEEIVGRRGPFRQPLGLLVILGLEKDGTSGGKIEITFPARLRNDRLQDGQNYDRRPEDWQKSFLNRNEPTCKPDEKNNSREGNCI